MARLDTLKKVIQDVIDSEDMEVAVQLLAKYNLEVERPNHFFCSMMKKCRNMAQFCSLIRTVIDEDGEEVEDVLKKLGDIEDKVCTYYEKLYKNREVEHYKEEIMARIGPEVKKISE